MIVSPNVTATDTSTAVRRQHEGDLGDVAYVAQIVGTTLTVKRATITVAITDMIWETVETIANCSNCALAFDGAFVRGSHFDVEYETNELPWLFYVTSTGQLMAGVLGGSYESLVGANVTAIDAVRGVASKYKDIDQGLIVFYAISGSVYYRQRVDGTWLDQESVSLAPANVVSIKAERTFDYRIVLQITDNAGALHEVFSRMESSGWQSSEYLRFVTARLVSAYRTKNKLYGLQIDR